MNGWMTRRSFAFALARQTAPKHRESAPARTNHSLNQIRTQQEQGTKTFVAAFVFIFAQTQSCLPSRLISGSP